MWQVANRSYGRLQGFDITPSLYERRELLYCLKMVTGKPPMEELCLRRTMREDEHGVVAGSPHSTLIRELRGMLGFFPCTPYLHDFRFL